MGESLADGARVGDRQLRVAFSKDGTSSKPITFVARNAGQATITSGSTRVLRIDSDDYLTFDGLKISGGSSRAVEIDDEYLVVGHSCDVRQMVTNFLARNSTTPRGSL